jgi:hypothetical protein
MDSNMVQPLEAHLGRMQGDSFVIAINQLVGQYCTDFQLIQETAKQVEQVQKKNSQAALRATQVQTNH